MTYTVVFVREVDGRYSVHVPALKGCHTWGQNLPHAMMMAQDAMACHLGSLAQDGIQPPPDVKRFTVADWGQHKEAVVYQLTAGEVAEVA